MSNLFSMVSASAWLLEDVAGTNVTVVTGSDSVLVVDTKVTPGISSDILKAIRKLTPKPIRYVALTHYRSVREFSIDTGHRDRTADSDVETRVSNFGTPSRPFVLSTRVFLEELEVQILQLDFGAFKGESMVWIPSESALIAGNLPEVASELVAREIHSYFQRWLFALNSISMLNLYTLVPAYGPPLIGVDVVAAGIVNTKCFLVDLYSKMQCDKTGDEELWAALTTAYTALRTQHCGPLILNGYAPFS